MSLYNPVKQASHHNVQLRSLDYCIHTWGDPGAAPVFLLHGWADTGMTFQFLADAMSSDWYLVAPDWRGFGGTGWAADGYWFPEYLLDLESLIDIYSPEQPVRLVGHSMGGNVAWLYAGTRPERVSHAVSLDVFGLPDTDPEQAPQRYAEWLEQCRDGVAFTEYPDENVVVERIMKLAPRISREQAAFLAQYWSRRTENGGYTMNADPAHRRVNPVLYRRQEALACWRAIRARCLLLLARDSRFHHMYQDAANRAEVLDCFADLDVEVVDNAGHALHQEAPAAVAGILEPFLRDS